MSAPAPLPAPAPRRRLRVATASLAGCFGCHMSFLDMDERLVGLIDLIVLDRSPLTDIKHPGPCDIALVEGGVCNAENVHVLRELRRAAKVVIALGACAVNGGLPAMRNHRGLEDILRKVYEERPDGGAGIPDDPELPLLTDKVHPLHEVVRVDYFLPGCPPSADAIHKFLTDLAEGRTPRLADALLHFD
ncbi:NADP oxidoreductase [Oharaeibacter diazotrophicus]|uniref:NAD-reducing hydrogenase small subunit n=1 Tax=Oharaeibacter diazotrophicus TaxID=1920512 RepID=A0A4R6R6Q9_9HYPH|nr:NADP oxidoreductase [Oharaeibacter diazotrophicus]TDP81532.1 NAD-reducing hydrogenase small subunit [Oharaeibacter diazotrophicus]BBE73770.1 NAD-reducing hydrogenase HoxS subunit delta [Pleomorphomonas sp. SM30]GLS75561.1 hydrogenase [Oharaeibacter diazotrophicus]